MAQEADVAALALQSRVRLQDGGVLDLVQVGVDDDLAVQCHLDAPALAEDLLPVPAPRRLQRPAASRHDAVDRAMILGRPQAGIPLGRVIQDLDLHAVPGGPPVQRRADGDAVVPPLLQAELEAEGEVRVLLRRVELPAAARGADQYAVLNDIPFSDRIDEPPAVETAAVEEGDEAVVLSRCGMDERGEEEQEGG